MISVLVAGMVVLFVLTVANLLLCLAIVRRLRAIEQPDQVSTALPALGTAVAPFATVDLLGNELSGTTLRGRAVVVGFLMPECAPCRTLVTQLREQLTAVDESFIIFVATHDRAAAEQATSSLPPSVRVGVVSIEDDVTRAFGGISAFPTLLRVDDGVVVRAGRKLHEVVEFSADAAAIVGARA